MPRTYKKKGTRVEFSEADMKAALEDVLKNKLSLRAAAERNNVKHTYRINYGLTYESTRKLAFEYALQLNKEIPESWYRNNIAGIEWMKGFMTRHPKLSLRKPENTSLSRATSFNPTNVAAFQDNYTKVMKKYNFSEDRIFNLDETGVMTVVQAPYIIAARGIKQVEQAVSGKRGKTDYNVFDYICQWYSGPSSVCVSQSKNVGTAYAASFTIHNIKQGFKKPGIWPINRNAFCDEDFESSFVTDRPSPVNIPSNNICSAQVNVQNTFNDASLTDVPNSSNNEPIPKSPSVQQNDSSVSQPGPSGIQKLISPESVRPYPKITEPRKQIKKRKKGSTKILTDTPIKNEIESDFTDRIVKKIQKQLQTNNSKPAIINKRKGKKAEDGLESRIISTLMENLHSPEITDKAKTAKRKVLHSPQKLDGVKIIQSTKKVKRKVSHMSDSSSVSDEAMSLHNSSDDDIINEVEEQEHQTKHISKNDFILVKFATKKSIVHYVAQVEETLFSEVAEKSFSLNILDIKGTHILFS
ncbi:hypothetical protein NQ314_010715 [Rhamnusium bicolor]|uniref:DDE-1 domain-containing protein n=1 Tax=Rhamnusium bicolor TaxID=1586634 RepID=A0AAV8XPU0_9CUCU|nr:hypothetical protein NQ314_010715 [Rhamnusium bicolor]